MFHMINSVIKLFYLLVFVSAGVKIVRLEFTDELATDLCLSWPKVLNLVTVRASLKTPV